MKRHTWLVVPAIVMLYCCNAEKKVLRSPDKTQHVVAAWMKQQNFKADTVFNFIPGDTTTTLLIAYDTTTVHDTATKVIEKHFTQTKVVTNTVHDTVKVTLKCTGSADPCALLKKCQGDLANNSIVLEERRLGEQAQKQRADKWFLFFCAVIGLDVLIVAVRVYLRFKP